MNTRKDSQEWVVFSEHKRLMQERECCLEQAKAANTLYLPLLGSTFKIIEDASAQRQMNAAMALMNKSVYVHRGTTNTTSVFAGLILIECIGRSDNWDTCVYLVGPLTNEKGVIYEDLIVRVAVRTHTFMSFR